MWYNLKKSKKLTPEKKISKRLSDCRGSNGKIPFKLKFFPEKYLNFPFLHKSKTKNGKKKSPEIQKSKMFAPLIQWCIWVGAFAPCSVFRSLFLP